VIEVDGIPASNNVAIRAITAVMVCRWQMAGNTLGVGSGIDACCVAASTIYTVMSAQEQEEAVIKTVA
jgi:hypothetical protein